MFLAEPPVLPQQREAEPFAERADQYHPARKAARNATVSDPGGSPPELFPECSTPDFGSSAGRAS